MRNAWDSIIKQLKRHYKSSSYACALHVPVSNITSEAPIEDMEESSGSNSPPQISIFDRIEAPITRASVFTRLSYFNQVEHNLTHIPQKSIQQRIGTLPRKSWR